MSDDERSIYRYHELDKSQASLRLCHLLPGTAEDDVHCELHETLVVTAEGHYEALSYTWGEPPDDCSIYLDSKKHEIRRNLWNALKVLRNKTETRIFWIDALCINQHNILEKNHQVAMMHKIFKSAQRVRVWLGPAADNSDAILRYIAEKNAKVLGDKVCEQLEQEALTAILPLLKRRYWSRAWIRQEVTLAKDIIVHCGNREISWRDLVSFCFNCRWQDPEASHMFKLDALRSAALSRMPLGSLLIHFSIGSKNADWQCSDTRDRIFSMLALAFDCQGKEHQIADYGIDAGVLYLGLLRLLTTCPPSSFSSTLQNTLELVPQQIAHTWAQLRRNPRPCSGEKGIRDAAVQFLNGGHNDPRSPWRREMLIDVFITLDTAQKVTTMEDHLNCPACAFIYTGRELCVDYVDVNGRSYTETWRSENYWKIFSPILSVCSEDGRVRYARPPFKIPERAFDQISDEKAGSKSDYCD